MTDALLLDYDSFAFRVCIGRTDRGDLTRLLQFGILRTLKSYWVSFERTGAARVRFLWPTDRYANSLEIFIHPRDMLSIIR